MKHVPKSDLLALAREFLKLELLLSESLNTEQLRKFLIPCAYLCKKSACRSTEGSSCTRNIRSRPAFPLPLVVQPFAPPRRTRPPQFSKTPLVYDLLRMIFLAPAHCI